MSAKLLLSIPMSMMEKAPIIPEQQWYDLILNTPSAEATAVINQINENYEYWDTVKHKYKEKVVGYTPEQLWHYAIFQRMQNRLVVWNHYSVNFNLTNTMQRMCHEFDMNFGGSWASNSIITSENKEKYLVSSQMEERYLLQSD